MVCKSKGIYGFLGTWWVLITMPPRNTVGNTQCIHQHRFVLSNDVRMPQATLIEGECYAMQMRLSPAFVVNVQQYCSWIILRGCDM